MNMLPRASIHNLLNIICINDIASYRIRFSSFLGRAYLTSVHNRDMYTHTSSKNLELLINKVIKSGNARHALSLYQKMLKDPFIPCVNTLVALLKACSKLKDLNTGKLIHSQICGKGLIHKNVFLGTALMDMYAKCGILEKMQEVFDELAVCDVVSWNTVISGYANLDRGIESLICFEQMHKQGVSPDAVTYACCLKACSNIGALNKGQEMHIDIVKKGFLNTNQIVGNALIDMYAKCGDLIRAREVFDTLPSRDIVSWNALIAGYAQQECDEEALDVFVQMKNKGFSPEEITLACVLKSCGSIGAIDRGLEIHSNVEREGLLLKSQLVGNALLDMYAKCGLLQKAQEVFYELPVCNSVSWNALITGYVHNEYAEQALSCFEQMRLQGVTPNAVTFTCTLKACASIGAVEKSQEIHNEVKQSGLLQRNQVVGNALIDTYAKCGLVGKAHEVFVALPSRNVVSWNTLITGYAQKGDFENVIRIFDRMREDGINPNQVTFLVVINACSHTGQLDRGHTYCEALSKNYGSIPMIRHHNCMVDLLTRAGQLDNAVALMKKSPSHPNNIMWLTLLGACRKWGNADIGKKAFDQALRLDETDPTAYVSMYNIYADASLSLERLVNKNSKYANENM